MWTEWTAHASMFGAAGAAVLLLPIITVLLMQVRRKSRVEYARPASTLPLLGNTLDFVKNGEVFYHWITDLYQEFQEKPVLLTCVGRPDLLLLSTPALVEDVYKTQFQCFEKGSFTNFILKDFIGNGIFAVDGAKWSRQRKTASNLFTMRDLRDNMTSTVHDQANKLRMIFQCAAQDKNTIDLFRLFNLFTIETFSEIGFGVRMGCLDSEEEQPFQKAFDNSQRILAQRFITPGWVWRLQKYFSIGAEGQLKRDMKVVNDTVYSIISQSLKKRAVKEHTSGKDIVSLFLDHVSSTDDSSSQEFDPTFLRDIVISFLIAGRDTTAQSLSWFFVNLTKHPHVAEKIREEIKEKLPELAKDKEAFPSMEQVSHLTYVEAAIKETLRLHPSVPMNTRQAAHDTVLCDGTFVKAGMVVGISTYAMGRMEHIWGPDAKQFNPDRWIDPSTGKIIPVSSFKFSSFHAGPRICLGMNLAMLEMKILTAGILRHFDIEVENPNVEYDFSLTLPVKGPLNARVSKV